MHAKIFFHEKEFDEFLSFTAYEHILDSNYLVKSIEESVFVAFVFEREEHETHVTYNVVRSVTFSSLYDAIVYVDAHLLRDRFSCEDAFNEMMTELSARACIERSALD